MSLALAVWKREAASKARPFSEDEQRTTSLMHKTFASPLLKNGCSCIFFIVNASFQVRFQGEE